MTPRRPPPPIYSSYNFVFDFASLPPQLIVSSATFHSRLITELFKVPIYPDATLPSCYTIQILPIQILPHPDSTPSKCYPIQILPYPVAAPSRFYPIQMLYTLSICYPIQMLPYSEATLPRCYSCVTCILRPPSAPIWTVHSTTLFMKQHRSFTFTSPSASPPLIPTSNTPSNQPGSSSPVEVQRYCAITKMIIVALLLAPGLGLALSEHKQWFWLAWSYIAPVWMWLASLTRLFVALRS